MSVNFYYTRMQYFSSTFPFSLTGLQIGSDRRADHDFREACSRCHSRDAVIAEVRAIRHARMQDTDMNFHFEFPRETSARVSSRDR